MVLLKKGYPARAMIKAFRIGLLWLLVMLLLVSCAPGTQQQAQEEWPSAFSMFPEFGSDMECLVTLEEVEEEARIIMTRTYQGLETQQVQEYFDQLGSLSGFFVTGKYAVRGDAERQAVYTVEYAVRSKTEQKLTFTIDSFADLPGVPSIVAPITYEWTEQARARMEGEDIDIDNAEDPYFTDVATMAADGLVYEYVHVADYVRPLDNWDVVMGGRSEEDHKRVGNRVYTRYPFQQPLTVEQAKKEMMSPMAKYDPQVIFDLKRVDPFYMP